MAEPEKPRCETCAYYRPHTKQEMPYYHANGTCGFRLPPWTIRWGEQQGEVWKNQRCDFHKEKTDG